MKVISRPEVQLENFQKDLDIMSGELESVKQLILSLEHKKVNLKLNKNNLKKFEKSIKSKKIGNVKKDDLSKRLKELTEFWTGFENEHKKLDDNMSNISRLTLELQKSFKQLNEIIMINPKKPVNIFNDKIRLDVNEMPYNQAYEVKLKGKTFLFHSPKKGKITVYEVGSNE